MNPLKTQPNPVFEALGISANGLAEDWQAVVRRFCASTQGQTLAAKLIAQQSSHTIYPAPAQRLRALLLTPLARVRLVILGQDPYHGPNQAEGLAFSVPSHQKIPPSLHNIFKEIKASLGHCTASHSLCAWAQQGVLLLNSSLSVEAGRAGSHTDWGWEALTDDVVETVAAKPEPVAFMLWGRRAHSKLGLIAKHNQGARHLVLLANHPSPLSALRPPVPFLGCGHFAQEADWARRLGYSALQW